jgi:hypothetical protein
VYEGGYYDDLLYGPAMGVDVGLGELADDWVRSLTIADMLAPPSSGAIVSRPIFRPEPAALEESLAPGPTLAAWSAPPTEPLLLRIPVPRNSGVRNMEIDPISAGDPLVRMSLGQYGYVDPAGEFSGGVDPNFQTISLQSLGWVEGQGYTTPPGERWRLGAPRQIPQTPMRPTAIGPRLNLPAALTAPAGADLSAWLLPLALLGVAVLALR